MQRPSALRSALKCGAAGAAAMALSGCAAALIPVAASGALMKRQADNGADVRQTAPAPAPVSAPTPTPAPVPAAVAENAAIEAIPAPVALANSELIGGSYAPFARHALAAAGIPVSVLPDPKWSWDTQQTLTCEDTEPAVLIDLDPQTATFDPAQTKLVAPGLGRALSQLRDAGLTVFWSSRLAEDGEGAVRAALARTGLDPAGGDRLLLARAPDEAKTVRRNEGVGGYCVVAIAGDRKGDFDMLFDYLREREGVAPFESLVGRGWFYGPPPLDN